jgi:predicted nuclease of predicted toxin-antitoxin system
MRVLLDECLPRRLKAHLAPHQVITVPEAGWAGTKDAVLLRAASGLVDVFITVDSNLAYQQRITSLPFMVVVLSARSNRLADLLPLMPKVALALNTVQAGQVVRIADDPD